MNRSNTSAMGPAPSGVEFSRNIAFDVYVGRICEALPILVPGMRIENEADVIFFRRGNAMVKIAYDSPGNAAVAFTQARVPVLSSRTPMTSKTMQEVTADLVGFFCGASLSTLSLYPHRGPKPVLQRRRRWNQRY
ncbi:MAG TPA: hypothetical protein VGX96_09285 [Candidatus Elarobacter sp.]|jgi:hypothetical protein|nr:hypothetical protein [Candidatus Elarobacter sp.]